MIPAEVTRAIDQALQLLPAAMDTPEARVMLLAIGLQESRLTARRQLVEVAGELRPIGPAKGLWQFERGGGCRGVVDHAAARYWTAHVCRARACDFNATAIWNAIERDDVLAAACARLLLFTDPKLLPKVDDTGGAWNLYVRTWRPGKPHRKTWDGFHAQAVEAVTGRAPYPVAA